MWHNNCLYNPSFSVRRILVRPFVSQLCYNFDVTDCEWWRKSDLSLCNGSYNTYFTLGHFVMVLTTLIWHWVGSHACEVLINVRRFFVNTYTTFEISAATFDFLSLFLDFMLVRFVSMFWFFFFFIIHHSTLNFFSFITFHSIFVTHSTAWQSSLWPWLCFKKKKNLKSQKLRLDF